MEGGKPSGREGWRLGGDGDDWDLLEAVLCCVQTSVSVCGRGRVGGWERGCWKGDSQLVCSVTQAVAR